MEIQEYILPKNYTLFLRNLNKVEGVLISSPSLSGDKIFVHYKMRLENYSKFLNLQVKVDNYTGWKKLLLYLGFEI
jgi:hypothetical protein